MNSAEVFLKEWPRCAGRINPTHGVVRKGDILHTASCIDVILVLAIDRDLDETAGADEESGDYAIGATCMTTLREEYGTSTPTIRMTWMDPDEELYSTHWVGTINE